MMVEPGMDVLLTKVDSKYTLVSVSSKRARKIMAKDDGSLENPADLLALLIRGDKVEWMREEPAEIAPEEEPDV